MLGRGLGETAGAGLGSWGPDLMQVESGLSPMKSILILCCLSFPSWGQGVGRWRERDTEKSVRVTGPS